SSSVRVMRAIVCARPTPRLGRSPRVRSAAALPCDDNEPNAGRRRGRIASMAAEGEGVVVLAATPIGQIGDAPPRLAEELAGADVIAAEDTRRLQRLLRGLGAAPQPSHDRVIVSYHEHNE